jgi:hypothetical protein
VISSNLLLENSFTKLLRSVGNGVELECNYTRLLSKEATNSLKYLLALCDEWDQINHIHNNFQWQQGTLNHIRFGKGEMTIAL